MGKKSKNKSQNQTIVAESVPKVENEPSEQKKEEVIVETKTITPEVKSEETKPPLVADSTENQANDESKEDGSSKSKKRRNRKKKNTAVEINADEQNKTEENKNITPVDVEIKNDSNEQSTDTLKKKRNRRNKEKPSNAESATTEEKIDEKHEEKKPETIQPAAIATEEISGENTLKKRKRNRNKNSKKTILDEIQEKQEREQKTARDHLKNEIAKREKLLETIDLVLDCHKSEVELAKNQQESLKDISQLSSQVTTKPKQEKKQKKQQQKPQPSPIEEALVNKIEQVLGVTKLELKNVQNQQAYVGRLEAEIAKVKQCKDTLLKGETPSVVPPHIQKMATEMCDLAKGEVPKTKEELVKEIESRDALMSEINKVLDTTKTEIEKVQKQQKIIQNLEVELNKMKEQEIAEKLLVLAEEAEKEEAPPLPPKQSSATASLLDALMANVGKLKEAQAMKEKQKAAEEENAKAEIKEKSKSPLPASPKEVPLKTVDSLDKIQNAFKTAEETLEKVENLIKSDSGKTSPKTSNVDMPKIEKTAEKKPESPKIEQKPKSPIVEKKAESPKVEKKPESPKVEKKSETKIVENKIEPTKVEKKPDSPKNEKKSESPKAEKKSEPQNLAEKSPDTPRIEKNLESNTSKNESKSELKVEAKVESKIENKSETKVEIQSQPKIESKPAEEVKPISSSEPVVNDAQNLKDINKSNNKSSPKDNKKNKKDSSKNTHKNQTKKADNSKSVPEPVVLESTQASNNKPSMAEMLKNAPDPPPEEVNIKPVEEPKTEAPLARPESAIIEVNPAELLNTSVQTETPIIKNKEEKPIETVKAETPASIEVDSDIVIVNKAEVEQEMMLETDEKESTDSKNLQGGGFVSPANKIEEQKDVKPLRKDDKPQQSKSKSPVKAPSKSAPKSSATTTTSKTNPAKQPQKQASQQPKTTSKTAATEQKKPSPVTRSASSKSPQKQESSATSKNANETISAVPTNNNVDNKVNVSTPPPTHSQEVTNSTPNEKPKIPPRPEATKTNKAAGNVANNQNQSASSTPAKTKTPSPSKPPVTTQTQQQSSTAKTKSTASPQAKPAAVNNSKPSTNTKTTNQKPSTTQQKKPNSKPSTAAQKSSSTTTSASESK